MIGDFRVIIECALGYCFPNPLIMGNTNRNTPLHARTPPHMGFSAILMKLSTRIINIFLYQIASPSSA